MWKDIIGHQKALKQLLLDLEKKHLPGAYIFSGPAQIGKSTIAKYLARHLQNSRQGSHIELQGATHLDTVFIDPEKKLKIADVRQLNSQVSMTKQSPYKIVIIKNFHLATIPAANAFLKTLEEPPPDTLFILTTTNYKLLLDTIVSRARLVKFSTVSSEAILKILQKTEMSEEEISLLSIVSSGRPGLAINLAQNLNLQKDYLLAYKKAEELLGNLPIHKRLILADTLSQDDPQIETFLESLALATRQHFLKTSENKAHWAKLLSKIQETGILLKQNVNKRLALENLLLNF